MIKVLITLLHKRKKTGPEVHILIIAAVRIQYGNYSVLGNKGILALSVRDLTIFALLLSASQFSAK